MRLIHGVRFLRQKTFSPNKSHVSFTGFRFLSAVRVRPEVRDRWTGCRLQTGLLTGESFSSFSCFSSSSSAAGAFPRSLGITHTHTHCEVRLVRREYARTRACACVRVWERGHQKTTIISGSRSESDCCTANLRSSEALRSFYFQQLTPLMLYSIV